MRSGGESPPPLVRRRGASQVTDRRSTHTPVIGHTPVMRWSVYGVFYLKVIPYAAGSVDSSVAYQWRLPLLIKPYLGRLKVAPW